MKIFELRKMDPEDQEILDKARNAKSYEESKELFLHMILLHRKRMLERINEIDKNK